MSRGHRRSIWVLCLGVGSCAVLLAVGRISRSSASGGFDQPAVSSTRPEATIPTEVESAPVVRADLHLTIDATGRLRPNREIEIIAELTGRVTAVDLIEGQHVEAGDELFRLDDRLVRIDLLEAEAELMQKRAAYAVFVSMESADGVAPSDRGAETELARSDHERVRDLFDQGLLARTELDRARRRLEIAELLAGEHQGEVRAATTGLIQAEQRVLRASLIVDQTVIKAPFSGRVADLEISVGRQLNARDVCMQLIDESKMRVDVEVLEPDLVQLRRGSPAQIRLPALPDRTFSGHVLSINPRIAEESGTARVTVIIDNPSHRLIPGQLAFVDLETERIAGCLLAPAAAVLARQEREVVFKIVGDRALWTYVETGRRNGGWVEVVEGLAAGDVVAVGGHFALAHESQVRSRLQGAAEDRR